jgi:DNA-binding NarL/FixJ family response regulator
MNHDAVEWKGQYSWIGEALPRLERLTDREHEVFGLIGTGTSNEYIATELGIAETTVKVHVSRILMKLDVPTRVRLGQLALASYQGTNTQG